MVIQLTEFNFLDHTTQICFALDQQWRVIYFNQKAQELFLPSQEPLLGQLISKVCTLWQEEDGVLQQESRRVIKEGEQSCFEVFDPQKQKWWGVEISPWGEGVFIFFRDLEQSQYFEKLMKLFPKITTILAQENQLEISLQKCIEILVSQLDILLSGIWIYSHQLKQLELQGMSISCDFKENYPELLPTKVNLESNGENGQNIFNLRYLSLEHSLVGLLAQTGQFLSNLKLNSNFLKWSLLSQFEVNFAEGLQSLMMESDDNLLSVDGEQSLIYFQGYPLIIDQELIGIFALWFPIPVSIELDHSLKAIAQMIALAIDRAKIKTALLSRREALLFKLANEIRNSLDLDTILKNAVSEIRSLLDVDYCYYLWCWSQGGLNSVMISHESRLEKPEIKPISQCSPEQLEIIGEKIEQLHNIRIDNIDHDLLPFERGEKQEKFIQLMSDLKLKAILLIPLKTRSENLGAIACSSQSARQWNALEIELLQGVVDQLALAIDQAEAFAQASATALAAQTQAQQLQLALHELKQAQTQLIQTEKMSSLGQMVAGIAHEINNPVNFITGNLNYTNEYIFDLLQLVEIYRSKIPENDTEIQQLEEEIDLEFIMEDLPKTVVSMQVGANRIREIVLSLRNFSRLDEADMKFADIHEGIDSTLLILQNRLKAKADQPAIEIIKNYQEIPKIECYPGQLNQVFMNIISNSIDAMQNHPKPCMIISSSIEIKNNSEKYVIIKIKDNGEGIEPENLKHIFDPFFTTKPVGKGTGLGLSISYQIIVDRHKGNIECFSQMGQGTEFVISIPFLTQSEE